MNRAYKISSLHETTEVEPACRIENLLKYPYSYRKCRKLLKLLKTFDVAVSLIQ